MKNKTTHLLAATLSFATLANAQAPYLVKDISSCIVKISEDAGLFKNAELTLFDAFGKEVQKVAMDNNEALIERADLRTGIYFYTVSSEGKCVGRGKLLAE